MASNLILSFSVLILYTLSNAATNSGLILTVVNNCPFTIWPAIQPNAGHPVLERGGFTLQTLAYRSFSVPTTQWSGRLWARTGCVYDKNARFTCTTDDCGRLECGGRGSTAPTTLAQFSLHGPNDKSSYSVSLVDGFNLPMTITPHEGQGSCPVVGCKADLLATCPAELKLFSPAGHVVGCKSACTAFKSDAFCCRNAYNSPQTCKATRYSNFFKQACPATYSYAYDTPSLTNDCSSPRELKVIFCH